MSLNLFSKFFQILQSISLDQMQGSNLHVSTTNGDINVESSYSMNSNFSTVNGSLYLKNIHKNCKVFAGPESDCLDMSKKNFKNFW